MNRLRNLSFFAVVFLLSACASLGFAPAKDFSASLAYGYGSYTAVNNTIAASLDTHRISSEDGKNLRSIAQEARKALDLAKLAYDSGDLADASNRLSLALTILDRITAYLDTRAQS